MNKTHLKRIFSDIRLWIVFFFAIRLLGISNAPLEAGHNWRQSLTNMITRNFVQGRANIFYPQIDMAGEKTGIIGSEFPIFNYLTYLFSSLLEYSHWHGRLINLLVTSLGLYFFYKLISQLFKKETAFASTIVLAVSIWYGFGRKIMPDTFSVSLVIIGLWYAYLYLKNGKTVQLLAFFILITLGMLSKIPALSLMGVLALVPFLSTVPNARKLFLLTASGISIGLVFCWYFYWVPHLLSTYHYQLYFPKSFMDGLLEIKPLIPELLEKFYFSAFHSYLAFACFLVGIYFFWKEKLPYYRYGFAIITLLFVAFIIKTGSVFPLHNYYIIPFVPVMALFAGIAIAKLPKPYYGIILSIIAIEAIANQQHAQFISENVNYKLTLEQLADSSIAKDELIIINGGPSPQSIYFANRKGWTIENEKLVEANYIDSLVELGAKKLIIDKHLIDQFSPDYELLLDNEDYQIYNLN
ncbi:MAG: glycosyltransferase family 39 protein [Flavobacteriales bacterium]|nr:glycosyltransferase family 39 protein [Flavobacteriales bacterium]